MNANKKRVRNLVWWVRHRFGLLIALTIPCILPVVTASVDAQVLHGSAKPGSIVRWSGEGIELCSFLGREFAPLDGACALAVDLDAKGELKASRRRRGRTESLSLRIGEYPYRLQRLTIKDDSRVHLSEANQKRAARERARLLALFDLETTRTFSLPLTKPLEHLPSGGRFGARRIINGEPRSPHTGADYAADSGTPVLAVADGTVGLAEEHFFSGNSIFVDHGDGLVTMYFHLKELFVEAGQKVTRGAVIGTVGSTGRSTGPHLHVGVRWHGARVDPRLLFSDEALVEVGE